MLPPRCILFIYHALGESRNDDPPLASMDFSAAGKSAAGRGRGQGIRGYKLIVASNRDEYLDRATSPIHFWEDANSSLLAGGGRWAGAPGRGGAGNGVCRRGVRLDDTFISTDGLCQAHR